MVGQSRPIWDFEDREDWWTRVDESGIAPIVAVPTTAGTGSEVGRASVITDEATHLKKIIVHPRMLPAIVISDPELTLGLPRNITAWTGMDALAHCLEAYCAPGFHPMADGIALEGHAPGQGLAAGGGGQRREPRSARPYAGRRQHGGDGVPKGPRRDPRHEPPHRRGARHPPRPDQRGGDALCARLQPRRHRGPPDRAGPLPHLPDPSFDAVRRWVLDLRTELGIAPTLADLGIGDEHVDELVPMAAIDPSCAGNPIPIGEPELREMFLKSIHGALG